MSTGVVVGDTMSTGVTVGDTMSTGVVVGDTISTGVVVGNTMSTGVVVLDIIPGCKILCHKGSQICYILHCMVMKGTVTLGASEMG